MTEKEKIAYQKYNEECEKHLEKMGRGRIENWQMLSDDGIDGMQKEHFIDY